MDDVQSTTTGFQLNSRPVVIGAALIGAGGLLAFAGLVVGGSALIVAARRWIRQLEVPPTDMVRHKWDQTRAATAAGAGAWQEHHQRQVRAREQRAGT